MNYKTIILIVARSFFMPSVAAQTGDHNAQDHNAQVFAHLTESNHRATASDERLRMVRASMNLPVAHEASFWLTYDEYAQKLGGLGEKFQPGNFIGIFTTASAAEVESLAASFIEHQYEQVVLKHQYFQQISLKTNGNVALQFLQMEAVVEFVFDSPLVEQMSNHISGKGVTGSSRDDSRRKSIASMVPLAAGHEASFWTLYDQYDFELKRYADVYDAFIYYLEEPADLIPAHARRIGDGFLVVQRNEVKLRQKYFYEMQKNFGSEVAARFILLDYYYSQLDKMSAFSNALSGRL